MAENDTEEGRAKNRRTEFKVLEFDPSMLKSINKTADQPETVAENSTSDPAPLVEAKTEPEPPPAVSNPVPEETPQHEEASNDPIESSLETLMAEMTNDNSQNEIIPSAEEPKKTAPEKIEEVQPEKEPVATTPVPSQPSTPDPVVSSGSELKAFSTDKANYYATHEIPIDPKMPEGVIFKIQIGAFSKVPVANKLNGLFPVMCLKMPNNIYKCSVGEFRNYTQAKDAQKKIRAKGFSDAFLVAFYNGKKISVSQAVNMQ